MEKYKSELLFFSALATISIVFPPVRYGIADDGFSFLFSITQGNFIDYLKLFTELILIILLTIIFSLLKYYINKINYKFKNDKKLYHFSKNIFLTSIIFLGVIIIQIRPILLPLTIIQDKYSSSIDSFHHEMYENWIDRYTTYDIFNGIKNNNDWFINNYFPLRNDQVKWDANLYVNIWGIYNWWAKYLLTPFIIMTSFLYLFTLAKKIKKYKKRII